MISTELRRSRVWTGLISRHACLHICYVCVWIVFDHTAIADDGIRAFCEKKKRRKIKTNRERERKKVIFIPFGHWTLDCALVSSQHGSAQHSSEYLTEGEFQKKRFYFHGIAGVNLSPTKHWYFEFSGYVSILILLNRSRDLLSNRNERSFFWW